jgi:hypothetical protein
MPNLELDPTRAAEILLDGVAPERKEELRASQFRPCQVEHDPQSSTCTSSAVKGIEATFYYEGEIKKPPEAACVARD